MAEKAGLLPPFSSLPRTAPLPPPRLAVLSCFVFPSQMATRLPQHHPGAQSPRLRSLCPRPRGNPPSAGGVCPREGAGPARPKREAAPPAPSGGGRARSRRHVSSPGLTADWKRRSCQVVGLAPPTRPPAPGPALRRWRRGHTVTYTSSLPRAAGT